MKADLPGKDEGLVRMLVEIWPRTSSEQLRKKLNGKQRHGGLHHIVSVCLYADIHAGMMNQKFHVYLSTDRMFIAILPEVAGGPRIRLPNRKNR